MAMQSHESLAVPDALGPMAHATPALTDGAPSQAWALTAGKVNDVVNRLVGAP